MHRIPLQICVLGSGTSTGVPMLACRCPVCTSPDPRDRRYRASVLLQWAGTTVVVDTTPEFRLQMLRANVRSLDAVLITHNHADHISGFDDLRQYTLRTGRAIPVYGPPSALSWIRRRFDYIWEAQQKGGGLPLVDLTPVQVPFEIRGVRIVPVPVYHGRIVVYGYRLGDFAYVTDVSDIPPASYALLAGVRHLLIDAVRRRPHSTHFHLDAALEAAGRIGAEQTWLTHLSHHFLHRSLEEELPPGVRPAWDGLVITSSVEAGAAARGAESASP